MVGKLPVYQEYTGPGLRLPYQGDSIVVGRPPEEIKSFAKLEVVKFALQRTEVVDDHDDVIIQINLAKTILNDFMRDEDMRLGLKGELIDTIIARSSPAGKTAMVHHPANESSYGRWVKVDDTEKIFIAPDGTPKIVSWPELIFEGASIMAERLDSFKKAA